MKLTILRCTVVSGAPARVGDVVEVDPGAAAALIYQKKAEPYHAPRAASAEKKPRAKRKRAAADE